MRTLYLPVSVTLLFVSLSSGCVIGNTVMTAANHALIRDIHLRYYALEVIEAQAEQRPPPTYDEWSTEYHDEAAYGSYFRISVRHPELNPPTMTYTEWKAMGKPKAKSPKKWERSRSSIRP